MEKCPRNLDFSLTWPYTALITSAGYSDTTTIEKPKINNQITAKEVRVIGPEGENLGILDLKDALERAKTAGLALIEISAKATPPVARIMDFGKYQYQKEKEQRAARKKAREVEIRGVRARVNISPHDLEMKVKKIEEFLTKGDRVRFELMLRGREKGMKKDFIDERLDKMFATISVPFEIVDGPKKGPRGKIVVIAPGKSKPKNNEDK